MQGSPVSITTQREAVTGVSLKDLAFGFLKIGLLGFGGVAPMARHVIVEDRRWLSEKEYASVLGVGQVLPGANTINAAVMIGDRFQGPLGAITAVIALIAMPVCIVIGFAFLYARFSALPDVRAALSGSGSAAAGLIMGAALKMGRKINLNVLAVFWGLLAFIAAGLLRIPLVTVVVILAPLSIGVAFLRRRS